MEGVLRFSFSRKVSKLATDDDAERLEEKLVIEVVTVEGYFRGWWIHFGSVGNGWALKRILPNIGFSIYERHIEKEENNIDVGRYVVLADWSEEYTKNCAKKFEVRAKSLWEIELFVSRL
jgi:hypothetical protein